MDYRSVPNHPRAVVQAALAREQELWAAALLFFGVGDVFTTVVGVVGVGSVAEGGPLVAWLLSRHGLAVLLALKLLTFGVGYALWTSVPRPYNAGAPLALAVLGVAVTTWNATVLAVAVH